jgi:hypothetical protein
MAQLAQRFGDGRQEIELVLDVGRDGDAARARDVLSDVPGVAAVDTGRRPTDPWILTVESGASMATVRSAILSTIASEDLPLVSIRAVEPSLEDVYRRAVAGPAGSRPAAVHTTRGEA